MSFRLIDDTLSIDNPHWVKAVSLSANDGGIYPSELTLNDTTPAQPKKLGSDHVDKENKNKTGKNPDVGVVGKHSDVVHFLGMDIMSSSNGHGRFRTAVFDKRNEFPFPVRRYPHMASLLPSTIPYGVFLGQLHRGYRTCSEASDFVSFACDVGKRLIVNGCKRQRLLQLFTSFIKRFVSKYQGVRLSSMTRTFARACR
jgi:hypothetical protein